MGPSMALVFFGSTAGAKAPSSLQLQCRPEGLLHPRSGLEACSTQDQECAQEDVRAYIKSLVGAGADAHGRRERRRWMQAEADHGGASEDESDGGGGERGAQSASRRDRAPAGAAAGHASLQNK